MEKRNRTNKSRGNGEGTIYFSETLQKYVAQYIEPATNKRKTLTQKKNEKVGDFKKRFAQIMNDINNNTYSSNSDITLQTILEDYITTNYKTGVISPRSYKRNMDTFKLLQKCCSDFIDKPIQKVNISNIRKALPNFVEYDSKIYSQNVINKLYMMLNKGFKIACSDRILTFNPMESESIKRPKTKQEPTSVEALDLEQQKALVIALKNEDHVYSNILLLALFTGMRIGEVLALQKNNINLKNKTIDIEKTLTRDENDKVIIGIKTKTYSGHRKLYMNDNTFEILNKLPYIENDKKLLFYDSKIKSVYTPNEINCYLQRLNKKYNICPHIHTHMLRHTFATRCIEAGMSAKVLQNQLGHASIETTLNTYTSVFEKFNLDENEKVNLYMKNIGL